MRFSYRQALPSRAHGNNVWSELGVFLYMRTYPVSIHAVRVLFRFSRHIVILGASPFALRFYFFLFVFRRQLSRSARQPSLSPRLNNYCRGEDAVCLPSQTIRRCVCRACAKEFPSFVRLPPRRGHAGGLTIGRCEEEPSAADKRLLRCRRYTSAPTKTDRLPRRRTPCGAATSSLVVRCKRSFSGLRYRRKQRTCHDTPASRKHGTVDDTAEFVIFKCLFFSFARVAGVGIRGLARREPRNTLWRPETQP